MLFIKSWDPNRIQNLIEFNLNNYQVSSNFSSNISENEQLDRSMSVQSDDNINYDSHLNNEINERLTKENIDNVNSTYGSYNSNRFTSRVADYGKKNNPVFKYEDWESSNSSVHNGPIKINEYIAPKMPSIMKDDYVSRDSDDGTAIRSRVQNSNNFNLGNTEESYDYGTYNSNQNCVEDNFVAFEKQDNMMFTTLCNEQVYSTETIDPK
jgi:hypothetical protein